jgi:hypothetical protein
MAFYIIGLICKRWVLYSVLFLKVTATIPQKGSYFDLFPSLSDYAAKRAAKVKVIF